MEREEDRDMEKADGECMEYTEGMSKDEIAQAALDSAKQTMIRILSDLPSAQPEPCEDMYGYIAIETLLNFCENSKDHAVTPNDFMRMARVRMPEPCEDAVSREAIRNIIEKSVSEYGNRYNTSELNMWGLFSQVVDELPPVTPKQPDLSEAYAKAVFAWLLAYQIRAAELKGRYTPYEVLSWVINDWKKQHEPYQPDAK